MGMLPRVSVDEVYDLFRKQYGINKTEQRVFIKEECYTRL
jgi:hypothetical protein